MASIYREFSVQASAERVWDRLRDFYAVGERLAPGFVTACRAESGVRVVTFENGLVVRELLVSSDDLHRRLTYTTSGGTATHHHASAQVFAEGDSECRFVWITDVLPDEFAARIEPMMERGCAAMKLALEAD